jgi:hypothetical protein
VTRSQVKQKLRWEQNPALCYSLDLSLAGTVDLARGEGDGASAQRTDELNIRHFLQALYRGFQKERHNGIPNVAVWRVLRKCLYLMAYNLAIVQRL